MNETELLIYLVENKLEKFQKKLYLNEKEILNENNSNDINYKNTIIHNLVLNDGIELKTKLKSIYILCDIGININAQNHDGQTAIHLVILNYLNHQAENSEVVDEIFEKNYGRETFELVNCLLINGCDLTIIDKYGNFFKHLKIFRYFER